MSILSEEAPLPGSGASAHASELRVAVALLHRRLVADELLAPAFAGIDRRRLAAHHTAFLAALIGEGDSYNGRPLATAHHGLGIGTAQFDRLMEHLTDCLWAAGLPAPLVARITRAAEGVREAVIDQSASAT